MLWGLLLAYLLFLGLFLPIYGDLRPVRRVWRRVESDRFYVMFAGLG